MALMVSKLMSLSPSVPPQPPSAAQSISTSTLPQPAANLPLRTIPGSYGLPLLGPLSDRLDYFWFQGPDTFFRKRMEKYNSTVYRTNMPPAFPFFTGVNPNVVAVLDSKSFAYLFDMEVVEKKNVLVGDFMPSVSFTGDSRVCAYLDTSEPQHARIKKFAMDVLKRSSKTWIHNLVSNLDTFFDTIETSISQSGTASYIFPLQKFLFSFLSNAILGADPAADPDVAASGYAMLDRWLALMVLPVTPIGVLQPLEELFLHSFSYPFFLVSGDYRKLTNFVQRHAGEALRRGQEEFGLTTEEAIHNLLFILGFNAFGGFSIFLPTLINTIAADKTGLQSRLREEVRAKTESNSDLTFDSVAQMELVRSVVYEILRMNPPVTLQYGRARRDFQISSHDSAFDVKKGELLCGYQPLAMRDSKVFKDPESFIAERFMREEGNELLSYLYWSNGRQSESPSESNKQCAGKDFVVLTACMIVARIFQKYDSITGDSSTITAVEKAT